MPWQRHGTDMDDLSWRDDLWPFNGNGTHMQKVIDPPLSIVHVEAFIELSGW